MKESTIWLTVIAVLALGSGLAVWKRAHDQRAAAEQRAQAGKGTGGQRDKTPDKGNGKQPVNSGELAPHLGQAPALPLADGYRDQHGQPFSDEQLRGKVWIANFTFTRCRGTCPEQTRRMAELQ
ncbi:MAG: SCO family protein, partial [Planctomycetales bacterium]|nr:SCO family protein [Planctomycetales bacterium]